jgi:hypothetical protein
MHLSTATLILAYVASIAVYALPVGESDTLVLRETSIIDAPVAQAVDSAFELDVRNPKKKKKK